MKMFANTLEVIRTGETVGLRMVIDESTVIDDEGRTIVFAIFTGEDHVDDTIRGLRAAQRDANTARGAGDDQQLVRDENAGGYLGPAARPAPRGVPGSGQGDGVADSDRSAQQRQQRDGLSRPRLEVVRDESRRVETDDRSESK